MKITDLIIDPRTLGNKFYLVGVKPVYAYKDGARTDSVSGYRYSIALEERKMERIDVKIDGPKRMEEPEGYVEVAFKEIEIYIYYLNREPQVAARAKGISLVSQKA